MYNCSTKVLTSFPSTNSGMGSLCQNSGFPLPYIKTLLSCEVWGDVPFVPVATTYGIMRKFIFS